VSELSGWLLATDAGLVKNPLWRDDRKSSGPELFWAEESLGSYSCVSFFCLHGSEMAEPKLASS
jgi:hypothetical protein